MDMKQRLLEIRQTNHLSQQEMADRLFVTRQAVSRWETGETQPNMETLKLIATHFNVSIDDLMGLPNNHVCQCCGMPMMKEELFSREPDGSLNDEYCKWCYVDGKFTYQSAQQVVEACVPLLVNSTGMTEEQARSMMTRQIPQLKRLRTAD